MFLYLRFFNRDLVKVDFNRKKNFILFQNVRQFTFSRGDKGFTNIQKSEFINLSSTKKKVFIRQLKKYRMYRHSMFSNQIKKMDTDILTSRKTSVGFSGVSTKSKLNPFSRFIQKKIAFKSFRKKKKKELTAQQKFLKELKKKLANYRRYRNKRTWWGRQKRQKKLSLFFFKYRRSPFFKRYRYKLKLLHYFFFRYTFLSPNVFSYLAKYSRQWFWQTTSRYFYINASFQFQIYFFLKQLFFFKKYKQYSLRTARKQIFRISFKKLRKLLGSHFIKINNRIIFSPYHAIFLHDLVEISYKKVFSYFFTKKKLHSLIQREQKREKKQIYRLRRRRHLKRVKSLRKFFYTFYSGNLKKKKCFFLRYLSRYRKAHQLRKRFFFRSQKMIFLKKKLNLVFFKQIRTPIVKFISFFQGPLAFIYLKAYLSFFVQRRRKVKELKFFFKQKKQPFLILKRTLGIQRFWKHRFYRRFRFKRYLLLRRTFRRKKRKAYLRGFWKKYKRLTYFPRPGHIRKIHYLRFLLFSLDQSHKHWRSRQRLRSNLIYNRHAIVNFPNYTRTSRKQVKKHQRLIRFRLARKLAIFRLMFFDLNNILNYSKRKQKYRRRFWLNYFKSLRMLVYIPIFFLGPRTQKKPKKWQRYKKFGVLKRRDLQFLYFNNISNAK